MITKGQKYRTKNKGDFHAETNLIVIKVTGQTPDDLVYWKAETPIKYKRRYNHGKARVWWFNDFCELVKGGLSE